MLYLRGPWKGLEDVEFATLEWVIVSEEVAHGASPECTGERERVVKGASYVTHGDVGLRH